MLDLDDAAMSEPAVDVANFAAHLRLLRYQHPEAAADLARVEAAFVDRYRLLDPELEPSLYHFLTAVTMLRLAGIHCSRVNGREVARLLLETAGDALDAMSACIVAHVPHRFPVRQ